MYNSDTTDVAPDEREYESIEATKPEEDNLDQDWDAVMSSLVKRFNCRHGTDCWKDRQRNLSSSSTSSERRNLQASESSSQGQRFLTQPFHGRADIGALGSAIIERMQIPFQFEALDILLTTDTLQQLQETIYPVGPNTGDIRNIQIPVTLVLQRGERLFFQIDDS